MVTTFFQVLSIWQLKAARQAAELKVHSVHSVNGSLRNCGRLPCPGLPCLQFKFTLNNFCPSPHPRSIGGVINEGTLQIGELGKVDDVVGDVACDRCNDDDDDVGGGDLGGDDGDGGGGDNDKGDDLTEEVTLQIGPVS